MLKWKWWKTAQRSNLVVADIEFFYLVQFLEFNDVGEVVVRKDQNLKIGEFRHEWEFLDFKVRKIGKLEDWGIFYFKFGDIKLLGALEHEVFV